jgi:CubicO group peptidase (beta-lactamase class C family)
MLLRHALTVCALLVLFPTTEPAAQASLKEPLDAVFSEFDRDDGPGLAAAVIFQGEMLYENGFGLANVEQATPITPDTIFRIGSTSKQFTAFCIALLADRGELDLDADIRTYITELPEFDTPVSVRNMVHHTSGIPDYVDLHRLEGVSLDDHITTADTLETLGKVAKLSFEPGEQWAYSNSNYLLLGELVRRISGSTLREFAEQNIFEPLGMTSTHYHDQFAEVVVGRADGYMQVPGSYPVQWLKNNTTWDQVGDGGVFTSVRDLARWDANFYDNKLGGGQALLDLIQTPGKFNNGDEHQYAFGLGIRRQLGRDVVEHAGGWVGFSAQMMRFPEESLTVIVLSNCQAPSAQLAMQLSSMLLGAR